MKTKSLVNPLVKFAAAAFVAAAIGSAANANNATIIASDNASNYSGGWTDGSNGGTGFGNWTISIDNNPTATPTPYFAGAFIGDPTSAGIQEMPVQSFGLYANPNGTNATVTVARPFSQPMQVGDSFSFQWATNWDSGAGNKGFNIFASGSQILNVNQGDFPGNITFNGTVAIDGVTGYGNRSMTWTFTRTSESNLLVTSTARDGSPTIAYSTNVTLTAAPTAFSFYSTAMEAGDQRQPYFNNLQITSTPTAPSIAGSSYVVAVAGASFSYQISASQSPTSYNATGLPAGLTLNSTTGLISGSASSTGTSVVSLTATNSSGTSAPFSLTISVGVGADTADNYSGNWVDGSNQGVGFGNWTITSNSGTAGFAGAFIGNPSAAEITGLPSSSFSIYANPNTSGAFVNAVRTLATPLAVGQSFSFQWGINWDSGDGGNKGFSLWTADGESIVVNNPGAENITVESKTGNSTTDTGFSFGTAAMLWTFTQTGNTSVSVTATPRGSGAVYSTSLPTTGPITAFMFYASNMQDGNQRQPYFNNFLITPGSTPPPAGYDAWAGSYGLNATATTGPTAGAPTADPDSDSFTNQQEYAFGTNPTEATAGLVNTSHEGGNLIVRFLTRSNLVYKVQTTNNLATTPFADNEGIVIENGPTDPAPPAGYIRKQFSITPTGDKNFYRVIAMDQPPA